MLKTVSSRCIQQTEGPSTIYRKSYLCTYDISATLECFRYMTDLFGTSKDSYHASIKRMSSILVSVMPEVVKLPSNQQECNATSDQFSEKSHWLKNVIGAIDGCHIQIKAPKHQPYAYFNRKQFYSIILLGCCNSKMEINYVWTGNPGSTHDATVLRSSDLFQNSDVKIPADFYLLGDSAFPILDWLITPFRDFGNLTLEQKRFNKAHS